MVGYTRVSYWVCTYKWDQGLGRVGEWVGGGKFKRLQNKKEWEVVGKKCSERPFVAGMGIRRVHCWEEIQQGHVCVQVGLQGCKGEGRHSKWMCGEGRC